MERKDETKIIRALAMGSNHSGFILERCRCIDDGAPIAWLMVHHIPDIEADQKAHPQKITTVVWFHQQLKTKSAVKIPSIIYFCLDLLLLMWLFPQRPIAGTGSLFMILWL